MIEMPTKNLKLSLSKQIWEIINKDLYWLGKTESQRLQHLITSSLILKSHNTNTNGYTYQDIKDSVDIHDHMISTTLELLTEQKIISSDKWKDRMYEKVIKDVDNFNP